MDFEDSDYWKSIILYGLNQATYKIALGKTLLAFALQQKTVVTWDDLATEFFDQYRQRLQVVNPRPQQSIPARQTKMEQIFREYEQERISRNTAIQKTGDEAFVDVVRRFHRVGNDPSFDGKFYRYDFGRSLTLTDAMLDVGTSKSIEIQAELDARWSLLEGAFLSRRESSQLNNDLREIYLSSGYARTPLTGNIPFLQGYQGNTCFYCGEPMAPGDTHVDHVLPRQVVYHDEIWNLVLSHGECNLSKSDRLVGTHYMEKLSARNENIMGSNHPWKQKIHEQLGSTPSARKSALYREYRNVKRILGDWYWGGVAGYNPESDMFYRRLITKLNNSRA